MWHTVAVIWAGLEHYWQILAMSSRFTKIGSQSPLSTYNNRSMNMGMSEKRVCPQNGASNGENDYLFQNPGAHVWEEWA